MLEFRNPIPVLIKESKREAYAIYVTNSGMWDNDVWCLAMCDTGEILHATTSQLLMYRNATFGIGTPGKVEYPNPGWTPRGD